MKLKARLFLLWIFYAALLVWGAGAIPNNSLRALLIVLGSLLGVLLPKLVSAVAEIYLVPNPEISNLQRFINLFWQDSHSLVPSTKIGQAIYSYPFLFGFGVVALFMVTSTSNWFGKALVLGMGLRLVADLFVSNRNKQVLKQRWFAAFATKLSDGELDVFVYGTLALFVILTVIGLRNELTF